MSQADALFIRTCREILDTGVWDTDQNVRPRLGRRHPRPYH